MRKEEVRAGRKGWREGSYLNSIPPLLHVVQLLLQLLSILDSSGYQLLTLGTHGLVHGFVSLNVSCRLLQSTQYRIVLLVTLYQKNSNSSELLALMTILGKGTHGYMLLYEQQDRPYNYMHIQCRF